MRKASGQVVLVKVLQSERARRQILTCIRAHIVPQVVFSTHGAASIVGFRQTGFGYLIDWHPLTSAVEFKVQ